MKTLLAAALSGLLWCAGAAAQSDMKSDMKQMSLARAERLSVELKQGMTADEVKGLLGNPRRTALKTRDYGSAADGSLQWTYTWTAPSQSERTLQVGFASKTPGAWTVNSWEWSGH
jgi:hypothetical protein